MQCNTAQRADMTSLTDRSGSAKRPWPFNSNETLERRPAFTPAFDSVAGYKFGRHDAADRNGWMQESDGPSSLGGGWVVSHQTMYGWSHGTTSFDQNDIFSSQAVETVHSNIWDDHTATQIWHPAWNAFQGSDIAGCNVAIRTNTSFTAQSAEILGQSDWNAQTTAQGLYPSNYPSLAPCYATAQPQVWTVSSDGRLALDNDTLAAQNFNTYDPNFAPWNKVAAEQESSCLELAENFWPTPNTQAGDAGWGATPQTTPETPVQIIGRSESTSNEGNGNIVCFGTVSRTSIVLHLFSVKVMTISIALRRWRAVP